MRRIALALLALIATWFPLRASAEIGAGRLVDLGEIQSAYADPRRVTVWLPSSYSPDGPRHAVLYMHDGQNLFDSATGYGGMEWKVDEVLDRLIREGQVRPTIVVGIWNTSKRLQEYVPSKAFAHLPPEYMDRVRGLYGGNPLSDGYLRFVVEELKPSIDRKFNVHADRGNTAVMGSSMGALVSLYAIGEYPQVFGAAGMISTHWPLFLPSEGEDLSDEEYEIVSSAFERYLSRALPPPATHRLYFDHGDETLDRVYSRYQQRMDEVIEESGYERDRTWVSRNFPGQAHNEISWSSRLHIPLKFLLPPMLSRDADKR